MLASLKLMSPADLPDSLGSRRRVLLIRITRELSDEVRARKRSNEHACCPYDVQTSASMTLVRARTPECLHCYINYLQLGCAATTAKLISLIAGSGHRGKPSTGGGRRSDGRPPPAKRSSSPPPPSRARERASARGESATGEWPGWQASREVV